MLLFGSFFREAKQMIFEERVDWLLENDFYLYRVCSKFGPKKFHIIIGKGTKIYAGAGDTLSESFTDVMSNYEKGETWPPAHIRKKHSVSYEELDSKLKSLGMDLN